jgi:hypothetical protein
MLFDLRGRGRRRTVQVIYLGLAILMGGGLVLFGIGSSSSGGLFDAFSNNKGGGSDALDAVNKRIDAQLARVKADPKDADAFAQLAILRFQRAGVDGIAQDGSYTEDGKRRLALAADAWEKHLALDPKQPNLRAATLMVQAYQGLDDLKKAVRAKQIVTAAEKNPTSNQFQQLAALAYQAGDNRVGDLAATRAVDLAEPADRKELRTALDTFKSQVAAQQAQQATTTPSS